MATTGRYIEANGARVYCKVRSEDEVLGRPGISSPEEPNRLAYVLATDNADNASP
jgi:hypothetical protein